MNLNAIVKEYIEARDAYETASGTHVVSFVRPKPLKHGAPITRRWVEARKALSEAVKDIDEGESIS